MYLDIADRLRAVEKTGIIPQRDLGDGVMVVGQGGVRVVLNSVVLRGRSRRACI
jgi:hypothetical protein